MVGNLKKYGFEPKKFGMESFDGLQPCLTSVNRSESIFFMAQKANSVGKVGKRSKVDIKIQNFEKKLNFECRIGQSNP